MLLRWWQWQDWLCLLVARTGTGAAKKRAPAVLAWQLRSSLYPLSVTSFRNYVPPGNRDQGGITLFGDRYLLTNGNGDLVLFQPGQDGRSLEVEPLVYKVPINVPDFAAVAGTTVNPAWFRVADALAQETNGEMRLFVTHHYWKVREKCWVMRVSSLQGPVAAYRSAAPQMTWKTVFESSPCLPLARENEPPMFSGIANGGRMVLLNPNQLLVSVGDHEMDGWKTTTAVSQDMAYSHGKMILIHLDDLSSEIYTLGQRNPQGLALSSAGLVWSTEHGPEGGDELNLIERGGNYGWPIATYGTEYGTHSWPLSPTPGSHENFKQPFYSWVPSIGISSLIEVTSPRFENWHGDLLIGALKDQAFWRLRVREGRVVMTERIPFGERIRDVLQGHRGELVVWTDKSTLHFIAPSEGEDAESGESIYRSCAGCHVAPEGSTTAVGPDLRGIVGRAVASDPKFPYSPAMRALGGAWTEERLDAFLKSPGTVVPGTSMAFTGIPHAESRRKLIEYLASPASRLDVAPPTPL